MPPEEPSRTQPPRLGRAYWRLWTSSALSNLADGVFKIALPLVAVRFTRSPVLIAGLTTALTLPWLFFALHAGALADRLDRRRAMLGANGVRASVLALLMLAVLLDVGSIWALLVAALCIGVTETIFPERESALSLGTRMSGKALLNYVRLGAGFSIQEMAVPESWIGRTLRELQLPRRHRISVVALHDVLQDQMIPVPQPESRLKESDTLLVAGMDADLARAARVK
jgi:hypothetical protein